VSNQLQVQFGPGINQERTGEGNEPAGLGYGGADGGWAGQRGVLLLQETLGQPTLNGAFLDGVAFEDLACLFLGVVGG
jgi:hypothetical protein